MRFASRPTRLTLLSACCLVLLLAACGETVTPTVVPTATVAIATATTAAASPTTAAPTATDAPPAATTAPATATAPPSPTTAAATATTDAAGTPTRAAATPGTGQDIGQLAWQSAGLAGEEIGAVIVLSGTGVALAAGPGGVWRSSPGYASWEQSGSSFAFDPETRLFDLESAGEDVVYLTNYSGCAAGFPAARYRSLDAGLTWTEMGGEAHDVAAAGSGLAYATTCTGVTKTTDAGETWSALQGSSVENFDPIAVEASADGQVVYVAYASEGGSGRLMVSRDAGASWQDITPETTAGVEFFGPFGMSFVPGEGTADDEGGVYVTTVGGLWFLTAPGAQWQVLTAGTMPETVQGGQYFIGPVYVEGADTAGGDQAEPVIYASRHALAGQGLGSYAIYVSTNGGASWQRAGQGLPAEVEVRDLAVAPAANAGETLLAATGDGIWALTLPVEQ